MKHALLKRIVRSQSLALFALVLLGVFGYAHVSYADNWFTEGLLGAAGGLAGFFAHWTVVLVSTLAAKVLQVIAFLIDFGLQLNASVITNGIVLVGWKIARDIANFGFTIGLILISFATILRSQQYGAKKLLGKLVIVALLINFSLLIPGVILDGTHVFSNFFLSKIVGGERGSSGLAALSESLANSMNLQGFANINAGADNALSVENIADVIKIIIGGLFIIFFQVFAAITMGAVAFMVFFRYLILTFLLIVAPLAWISLFLPAFGNQWSKWWETFFKWAFFLPFMLFFLYLSIFAATHNVFTSTINNASGIYANINDIKDIIAVAAQMAVLIGLIFGSLMVAQKMGIAGAGAALGFATGARKFMLGAITGAAVGPAKYFGARPVKAGAMALANVLNKPALRWIPGMKGAVKGLSELGQRRGEVEEYMKANLDGLTPDQLKTLLHSKLIGGRGAKYLNPVERASLLAKAVKTPGMINELFKDVRDNPEALAERVRLFADAAKRTNPGTAPKDIADLKAILGVMPELAPELTDNQVSVAEATKKYVVADKMDEVSEQSYGNGAFLYNLSERHVKNLYENGKVSPGQIKAFENNVNERVGDDLVEIYKNISIVDLKIDYEKQRGASKKELDNIKKNERGPLLNKLDDRLKNLETVKTLPEALRNKYLSEAKTTGVEADLTRRLGRVPTQEELVLAMRNKTWDLFKKNRQQIGNPYGTFYEETTAGGGGPPPPGGPSGGPGGAPVGGGPAEAPPGGPTAGGAPAAPRTVPEMMGELRARREKEAQEAGVRAKAEAEAKRAAAGTAGFLGEMEEAEKRTAATRETRAAAERKGGDEGGELPPPSLPGTRPPTPPPSRPSTPAPARTPTPTPPAQPTQVPPRAPTPTPERTPTTPPQREATATPPSEATVVPPRAPTRATAEQGVEAEARRREEREEAARAATQAREAEEARAEAAKKTAEAAKETTTAEEAGLKAAEKSAERRPQGELKRRRKN